MTDTTSRVPPTPVDVDTGKLDTRTGWTGWVTFAGVMMIVIGSFQVVEGLTALLRDTYYFVGHNGLLLRVDYTGWGWFHLILGGLLILGGFGLFSGAMWARVLGVALTFLSALANLAFISAYPLWAILVIALDVFVIYAITVHGGEMRH